MFLAGFFVCLFFVHNDYLQSQTKPAFVFTIGNFLHYDFSRVLETILGDFYHADSLHAVSADFFGCIFIL